MLEFISRVKITPKQIERICHYQGEQIENIIKEKIRTGADKIYPDNEELYYVMMDRSMYLTREEKWKEMKLGRIFKATDNFEISKKRGLVTKSEYVCHLGAHTDFLDKLGVYTESLKNLVFINDGARWIWDWVETYYPGSVQILDFYHAKEHLCQFAAEYFQNKEERKDWVEEKCGQLLDDKIELVIDGFKKLPVKNEKINMVLLDVSMPGGMDGVMTLSKIKAMKPEIGVVMASGIQDNEVAKRAVEAGAYTYVTKPFDMEYLEKIVLTRLLLSC